MKLSLFILTFITAAAGLASSKSELCGSVDYTSFKKTDTIALSILDSRGNYYINKSVKATTTSARNFLDLIQVHGGAICNAKINHEAPFQICFTGDVQAGLADKIYCAKVKSCSGLHCGGNGFSVGSGSR